MKSIHNNVIRLVLLISIIAGIFTLIACQKTEKPDPALTEKKDGTEMDQVPAKQFKILHIMSYDAAWPWNQDQLNGFQEALEGVNVEYKIFEMDTKRRDESEWEAIGQEARDLIDTWKPDLVYVNDDNAQKLVTQYYINSDIPFVFSGVNAAPEEYGFTESTNVTGVLEEEHIIQTVKLLQKISPDVHKIAVVVDDGDMWTAVLKRMEQIQDQIPEIEVVSWDVITTFAEYKQKMEEYQTTVDAVGLIGIFRFKDEQGENVPYEEVLQWTAENSSLPDFTFWNDRIRYGTLCTVTVSGYEQGLQAGKIAYGILLEGRPPDSYAMEPTVKGEPVISLARANALGMKIDSEILLTSDVMNQFEWEK